MSIIHSANEENCLVDIHTIVVGITNNFTPRYPHKPATVVAFGIEIVERIQVAEKANRQRRNIR